MNDATQALAGAVTVFLHDLQEKGVPDKELESVIDKFLNLAVDEAKKLIARNLDGIREADERIELVSITKEEQKCRSEESGSVPEL